MIEYSHCPVCLGTDFKEVFQAKDYTVSGNAFGVAHCSKCEHRFTNPVPNQAEIGPYYKSADYVSHTNTSKGLIHGLYQSVRKYTLKAKRRLVASKTGKDHGAHLDVGSGAGAFLATMKAAGWDTLGLEPDPDARAVAKSDFGVDAKPVEELFQLPAGSFDAITMWHVLEHVHQLDAYMQQLKALLKVDGRLFIAVPNYTSVDAQVLGPKWAAYDVPRHLYHFSPASMRHLLTRHGFILVGTKRMPFDSFYVSMLSERNTSGSLIRGVWIGFRSWAAAIFSKERCSSLIYIIQK
jgi:2-polyprenyl-3-methyl-5-hydroxy-6-metoxy-1,4-benzoquinol methylase